MKEGPGHTHFPSQSAGFRASIAHKKISNVPQQFPKSLCIPELSDGPALASDTRALLEAGPYPKDSSESS